jgi:hypothetical protein
MADISRVSLLLVSNRRAFEPVDASESFGAWLASVIGLDSLHVRHRLRIDTWVLLLCFFLDVT